MKKNQSTFLKLCSLRLKLRVSSCGILNDLNDSRISILAVASILTSKVSDVSTLRNVF